MYRRRLRKNRTLSFNGIIILFIFISLFLSVGYSLLVQDLTIGGTTSLVSSNSNDSISSDDLKFTYEKGVWYSNNLYYYQFDMHLENISTYDIKNWQIIIDVPDDAVLVGSWNNNISIQDGKLIINNGLIEIGDKLSFGCQISTSVDNFDFDNVILNGEKIIINDSQESEQNNISIVFSPTNNWQSGDKYFYQYNIVIKNNGDYNISSWQFDVSLPSTVKMESMWGANYVNKDSVIKFSNLDYNGTINIGGSVTFGGIFSSTDSIIDFEIKSIVTN